MSDVSEDELEQFEEESEEEEEEEETEEVEETIQEEYEGSSVKSDDEERVHTFNGNDDFIARTHPQERFNSYEEVKPMIAVTRDGNECVVDPLHTTTPIMTKFEYARILGVRAKQINDGCAPLIETDLVDGAAIALEELRQKKLPILIRRPIHGGHEYWRPEDLENLN